MSSNNGPARAPESYTVPTRNASILGYGAPRPDGRLAERRRPTSSKQGNPALRAYAMSLPHGTGANLTDRDLMILCFLSNIERHRRATKVFNARGEWYARYKYMTMKDDAFLASVGMPRFSVPRTATDRPTNRNQTQLALEEAEAARRRAATGLPDRGYGRDEPGRDNAPNPIPSVFSAHSPTPSRSGQSDGRTYATPRSGHFNEGRVFTPQGVFTMEVALVPEYSETKALEYLNPDTPANMLILQAQISFASRYEGLCANILRAFRVYLSDPYTSDLYVGDLFLQWLDPRTGLKEFKEIFAHNWRSEIVPFIASHSVEQLSLRFGLYVVDKWDDLGNLVIEGGKGDKEMAQMADEEMVDERADLQLMAQKGLVQADENALGQTGSDLERPASYEQPGSYPALD